MERVILHSDLNSFYASVECLLNPLLRGKPVAVGGDVESRHGIILTKNQEAKKYGIQVGQAIWEAKQLCRELVVVPPHFDTYVRYGKLAREIYGQYTDQVEPYGIDECWLDVSGSTRLFGGGKSIADEIRGRIRRELGLTVSVGVSFCKVFAKLASDMRKPDATIVLPKAGFRERTKTLPVCDLLFVGPSTTKKLREYGIYTIGDLAKFPLPELHRLLGKAGDVLHAFANGQDYSPVAMAGDNSAIIKSVGNSTTCPRDLVSDEDAKVVLTLLADSVAGRLREQGLKGKTVVLFLRDNQLKSFERQAPMKRVTDVGAELTREAFSLFQRVYGGCGAGSWPKPLRGLGVRVTELAGANAPEQTLLFGEERYRRQRALELAADGINRRYGKGSVCRGILLADKELAHLDENIQSALQERL